MSEVGSWVAMLVGSALYFGFLYIPVGPVAMPLGLWYSTWSERRSHRKRRSASNKGPIVEVTEPESEKPPGSPMGLSMLWSPKPVAILLLALTLPIGFAHDRWDWGIATAIVIASSLIAYRWQLDLRSRNVRWAPVYAITAWALPMLACAFTFVVFDLGFRWTGNVLDTPDWVWDVENRGDAFPRSTLLLWTACGTVLALSAAVLFTFATRPLVNPLALCVAAFVLGFSLWVSNPMGAVWCVFTMMLLGHAVSRESRARTDAAGESAVTQGQARLGLRKLLDRRSMPASVAATAVVAALFASLIPGFQRFTDEGLGQSAYAHEILVIQAVLLALVLIPVVVIAAVKQALPRYGALLCGIAWYPIFTLLYRGKGLSVYEDYWLHAWTVSQMIAVGGVAAVMLLVMWRVFGPGAVDAEASSG